MAWEPWRKDRPYVELRHRSCGGKVVPSRTFFGKVCEGCGTRWNQHTLDGWHEDAMAVRFEGFMAPEASNLAVVWIEEATGVWHLGGMTGWRGEDEGTLTDRRKWKRWTS